MGSVEEDLKNLSINLSEKTQQLSALNRKKGGNLAMAPLEEVLTPDVIQGSGVQFLDTDYLRTVVVVINKYCSPGSDSTLRRPPSHPSSGQCEQPRPPATTPPPFSHHTHMATTGSRH